MDRDWRVPLELDKSSRDVSSRCCPLPGLAMATCEVSFEQMNLGSKRDVIQARRESVHTDQELMRQVSPRGKVAVKRPEGA